MSAPVIPTTYRWLLAPILAWAGLTASTHAQVIDVTNGSSPYVPSPLVPNNSSFDNTPLIDAIMNATPNGATLFFPTGDYYFGTPPGGGSPATVSSIATDAQIGMVGKTGVTIQGQTGTNRPRLIMRRRDRLGLAIRGCSSVVLENVTLQYDVPPFTQGTIMHQCTETLPDPDDPSMNISVRYLDLQIATTPINYPNPLIDPIISTKAHALVAHDPVTRRILPGTDQYYVRTDISDPIVDMMCGLVRVRFNGEQWGPNDPQVGDLFTLKANNSQSILRVEENTGVVVRDVDVRMSCSSAVSCRNNDGAVYERIQVLPFDDDALLSSNRDGMHIMHPRNGPTVRDCTFERIGDDGIAVRSNWIQVDSVNLLPSGDTELGLLCVSRPTIQVGDTLELFHAPTFASGGTAAVTVVNPWDPKTPEGLYPTQLQVAGYLPAVANDYIMDLDVHGQGFLLTGNAIRDHRARGMFIKASGGSVVGNVIERSTMAGILVGPQIKEGSWQESGFVRDVTIQGNQIRQVLSANTDPRHSAAIAVMVEVPGLAAGVNDVALQHRNLSIVDNVIQLSGRTGVLLMNVDGADVSGNRVFDGYWNPYSNMPTARGMDGIAMEMINLQKSFAVSVHDNKIETVSGHVEFHQAANCVGCSFTDNLRVVGTGFDEIGVPGFPSTTTNSYYNNSTALWTHTEDGQVYTMRRWGLFGNHDQYPYYLNLQGSRCSFDDGTLEVAISDAVGVEFRLGSNFLTTTWKCAVELEPVGGTPVQLALYGNDSTSLDPTLEKPYFTRIELPFNAPGPHVLRFRRLSPGDNTSPYLYLDDLLVEYDPLTNP